MADLVSWWRLGVAAILARSTATFYDRIADVYDQFFVEHHQHAERMADIVREHLVGGTRPARILDLGCGTGLLARKLADEGLQVLGLDVSRQSLTLMLHASPASAAVEGDALCLPVRDASFDAVVSLGAWRHFTAPARTMAEVARVLRRDGVVVLGYFPPSLGGVIHRGNSVWRRALSRVYSRLTKLFGYQDRVDDELEREAIDLARARFGQVTSVASGTSWRLIVGHRPRAHSGDNTRAP